MSPTLVLDTSVLIAGLRSSLDAPYRGYHAGRGAPASGGRTMNGFTIELPAELQAAVSQRASRQPGGESAWVADAVREKLAACAELKYLEARAARGSRGAYERVLAKVPAVEPVPGDERLPPG